MGDMTAILRLYLLIFLSVLCAMPVQAKVVHVLNLKGAISPASADYLVRSIDKAAKAQAYLVVIELDTPGGLDTSMRDIIKSILASPIPVTTYVSPKGARAASAGTYILYASHIAAMAPATNLGAATPVDLAPSKGTQPEKPNVPDKIGTKPVQEASPQDTKSKKVINDSTAYIRSLAELRGRNVDWAERAVREAVSLSADAAFNSNVVDIVAENVDDLLRQLHGRKVKLSSGEITLDTVNLTVVLIEPDWRSKILAVIGNPSIAYMLMLLGIYGLIYEFANPGMGFSGVIGGICLLLALFAFQLMPISYVGLALIILGVTLMVSETFLPSFGVIGLGGIVAFAIGSVMLIDTDLPGYGISWALIVPIATTTALFIFLITSMALRAHKRPVVTGSEELLGAEGEVLDDMQKEGWARVHGELWRVRSSIPLARGSKVNVTARHNLILEVKPID
jgi:membrane-bound serine protease (ClpP class)